MKPIDLFTRSGGFNGVVDLHWIPCSTIPLVFVFPKRDPDLLINPLEHALQGYTPYPTRVLFLFGFKYTANGLDPLFPRPHQILQRVRDN